MSRVTLWYLMPPNLFFKTTGRRHCGSCHQLRYEARLPLTQLRDEAHPDLGNRP